MGDKEGQSDLDYGIDVECFQIAKIDKMNIGT